VHSNTQYKPGDVANGYLLTERNEWVPLPAPVVAAPKPKTSLWVRWYMIVLYVVVGLVVIGQLAGGSEEPAPSPAAAVEEVPAEEQPAADAPAEEVPAEEAVEEAPAAVEEDDGVVAWGERFDAGDGNWISVSKPRHETGIFGDPVTVVDITLHNGTDEPIEVDAFTIFAEAMHGKNGKTAEWAILDSTPIDGAALPGRNVTGEYAFEGRLDDPVVVQVKAWDATAYFG
jgi:hypothetical protein